MNNGKYSEWLTPERLQLVEGWAREGLTEAQIAHNMGIAIATLTRWKRDYEAFQAALKKGKEVVDYEVENSLFDRCIGYDVEETTTIYNENDEVVSAKIVKRHVPADVTAMIFWLKNRRPDKWRDRKEEAININPAIIAEIEDFMNDTND